MSVALYNLEPEKGSICFVNFAIRDCFFVLFCFWFGIEWLNSQRAIDDFGGVVILAWPRLCAASRPFSRGSGFT